MWLKVIENYPEMRFWVAQQLAQDPSEAVRMQVTLNAKTPKVVLVLLGSLGGGG